MQKTIFDIRKMDCPAEESLIRLKLEEIPGIKHLEFDIPNRRLTVFHQKQIERIEQSIASLNLDDHKVSSVPVEDTSFEKSTDQRKLLITVLIINFSFFLIEMSTGLISRSMGLVADSLDMLADAFVYGISLFAVGGSVMRKKNTATIAGYFQIVLAIIGFGEVLRRFFGNASLPDYSTMIIVSVFALIANAVCLYLLQQSKSKEEAHMRASMIFTSNDIIINFGVILAGAFVYWMDSAKPDLIIGTIVFILVIQGAVRILKLGK